MNVSVSNNPITKKVVFNLGNPVDIKEWNTRLLKPEEIEQTIWISKPNEYFKTMFAAQIPILEPGAETFDNNDTPDDVPADPYNGRRASKHTNYVDDRGHQDAVYNSQRPSDVSDNPNDPRRQENPYIPRSDSLPDSSQYNGKNDYVVQPQASPVAAILPHDELVKTKLEATVWETSYWGIITIMSQQYYMKVAARQSSTTQTFASLCPNTIEFQVHSSLRHGLDTDKWTKHNLLSSDHYMYIRDPVSYFAQHNVDKQESPQVTTNKSKKSKPKSKDSKAAIPGTEDAVKSDLPADAAVDVPAAAAPAPATPAAEGSPDVSGGPKAGPAKGVDALRKEVFSGKNRKPATPADVAPALHPPSSDPAAAVPDAQPPAAAKTEPAKGELTRRMDKLRKEARSQARAKQTPEPVAEAVDPIAPAEERGPDVPPKPKSAAMAKLQHHVKHGGAAVQPAATPTEPPPATHEPATPTPAAHLPATHEPAPLAAPKPKSAAMAKLHEHVKEGRVRLQPAATPAAHPPAAHTKHPPAVEPPAAHTQHPPAAHTQHPHAVEPPAAHTPASAAHPPAKEKPAKHHPPAEPPPAKHEAASHAPAKHETTKHAPAAHEAAKHAPAKHETAKHAPAAHEDANHAPAEHKPLPAKTKTAKHATAVPLPAAHATNKLHGKSLGVRGKSMAEADAKTNASGGKKDKTKVKRDATNGVGRPTQNSLAKATTKRVVNNTGRPRFKESMYEDHLAFITRMTW